MRFLHSLDPQRTSALIVAWVLEATLLQQRFQVVAPHPEAVIEHAEVRSWRPRDSRPTIEAIDAFVSDADYGPYRTARRAAIFGQLVCLHPSRLMTL